MALTYKGKQDANHLTVSISRSTRSSTQQQQAVTQITPDPSPQNEELIVSIQHNKRGGQVEVPATGTTKNTRRRRSSTRVNGGKTKNAPIPKVTESPVSLPPEAAFESSDVFKGTYASTETASSIQSPEQQNEPKGIDQLNVTMPHLESSAPVQEVQHPVPVQELITKEQPEASKVDVDIQSSIAPEATQQTIDMEVAAPESFPLSSAPEPSTTPYFAPEQSFAPPTDLELPSTSPTAPEPSSTPPTAPESSTPPTVPEPSYAPPTAPEPSTLSTTPEPSSTPPTVSEPSSTPPTAPEPSYTPPTVPEPSSIPSTAPEPSFTPPTALEPSSTPPAALELSPPPVATEPSSTPPTVTPTTTSPVNEARVLSPSLVEQENMEPVTVNEPHSLPMTDENPVDIDKTTEPPTEEESMEKPLQASVEALTTEQEMLAESVEDESVPPIQPQLEANARDNSEVQHEEEEVSMEVDNQGEALAATSSSDLPVSSPKDEELVTATQDLQQEEDKPKSSLAHTSSPGKPLQSGEDEPNQGVVSGGGLEAGTVEVDVVVPTVEEDDFSVFSAEAAEAQRLGASSVRANRMSASAKSHRQSDKDNVGSRSRGNSERHERSSLSDTKGTPSDVPTVS